MGFGYRGVTVDYLRSAGQSVEEMFYQTDLSAGLQVPGGLP